MGDRCQDVTTSRRSRDETAIRMVASSGLYHDAIGRLCPSNLLCETCSTSRAAHLHFGKFARNRSGVGEILVSRPTEPHDAVSSARRCDLATLHPAIYSQRILSSNDDSLGKNADVSPCLFIFGQLTFRKQLEFGRVCRDQSETACLIQS